MGSRSLQWIGKGIALIGAIHTAVGMVGFRNVIGDIAERGMFNTVNGQPEREFAFWFIFFGLLAVLLGAVVSWTENRIGEVPPFLGWSLLTLTTLGVMIMPLSGFWLLIVPTVGALRRTTGNRTGRPNISTAA